MSTAKQRRRIRQETKLLVENLSEEEIYSVLRILETQVLRQVLQAALHGILLTPDNSPKNGEE